MIPADAGMDMFLAVASVAANMGGVELTLHTAKQVVRPLEFATR